MSYIQRGYSRRNYSNMHKISYRGRPRKTHSGKAWKVIDFLARMAIRKNIDPDSLFITLVDAWKHEESKVGNLVIKCRKKTRDSAIFLFIFDDKILGQFPVPESILKEKNVINNYMDTLPFKAFSNKETTKENLKIEDLEPRMKKVKLKARVLEAPEPKTVYTRFGTMASVSNFIVADETGAIKLSLWNHQIKQATVDDVITLKNAKVAWFRGKLQLRLGRNGELNVIEEGDFPTVDELMGPNVELLK